MICAHCSQVIAHRLSTDRRRKYCTVLCRHRAAYARRGPMVQSLVTRTRREALGLCRECGQRPVSRFASCLPCRLKAHALRREVGDRSDRGPTGLGTPGNGIEGAARG